MKGCWHCQDGQCNCILCGRAARGGTWIPGDCVSCRAFGFRQRHARYLDQFDPRERRYWKVIPAHDGNPVRRIFLPEEGLQ